MILNDKLFLNPIENNIYLDRYVNKGSPSGFSFKHTTSKDTSPKNGKSSFYLYGANFSSDISKVYYGKNLSILSEFDMIIHPDMINENVISPHIIKKEKFLKAQPTSSGRTLRVFDENNVYLKLHYQKLLGRINRVLEKNHALSSIEVSSHISANIDENKLPSYFYFMREIAAKVIEIPNKDSKKEWGVVARETLPYPHDSKIKFVIPSFSLFSKDPNNPKDPTILHQLILRQNKKVEDFLFEDLVTPIMDCYFATILNCGLQMDAQAQNTMIGIDHNFKVVGIISKDAESIDKDITLINHLGINVAFKSNNFKCISEGPYYSILHSYFFDFKLGEYLITPIIEEAKSHFNFNDNLLKNRIKKYNQKYIDQLPEKFFPKHWYNYAHVVVDRTRPRPWIKNEKPNYRF